MDNIPKNIDVARMPRATGVASAVVQNFFRNMEKRHPELSEQCQSMSGLSVVEGAPTTEAVQRPRILLAATLRWPIAARLALSFRSVGCHVEAVCPKGHPIERLCEYMPSHRYGVVRPLESLRTAIEVAEPDLIIPCDDGAALRLHQLYEWMSARREHCGCVGEIIEHSLGSPTACMLASARGEMADLARREGLRVPESRIIASATELNDWMSLHDVPLVLKSDNSWGGLGVRVVYTKNDALSAFRSVVTGPTLAKTLLRSSLDRDLSPLMQWLQHAPRVITAQTFVAGMPANRAVACWKGKVLAGISVEALSTASPTGPATVVRVIEHPEMSDTTSRLVRRLGLSGLWGFDFMLGSTDRSAWLIEVNPRATPICHLPLGEGRDLPAALCSQLIGRPIASPAATVQSGVICLFPGEWRRDPASHALHSAHHDVPWEEPGLMDEGIGLPWEERGLLARIKKQLKPTGVRRLDRKSVLALRSPP